MTALVHHTLTNYQPCQYAAAHQPRPYAAAPAGPGVAERLGRTLRLWQDRLRERRELATLTLRDLHDIGVTPSEVWDELRQPVWRSTLRR